MSHDLRPLLRILVESRRRNVPARFYSSDPPRDGRVRLQGDEARHLSRVCRLGIDDIVEVFDGRGVAFESRVIAVGTDWVDLATAAVPLPEQRPPISLVLASAVPKGDRFDWLVEKATELGVERLIPIVTERSVVEPGDSKLARLRRTIIEASKQCKRNRLMALEAPIKWAKLIASHGGSVRFVADATGISAQRVGRLRVSQEVILAVGPEGGLTSDERALATEAGWRHISLGTYTLRIETAALAGCAVLFAHGQELSG
jgi:16S rRNA (uracil1498-N3)-methyltransferase